MSVSNGQLANASTFNNAFVSKTANSTVSGDITMSGDLNLSGDLNSTGTITQDKESVLKEIATPATPASGYGKIYFKSDGKLYQMDDAGTETQVGSGAGGGGGGVNFITNGNAEGNVTTGWAVYADAAGTSPVDGTGGTANVTNTVTSTTPLAGTYSFLLAKDAANRQGQGWSYDFTIDQTYRAKVLQISFDYLVNSGTFTAGSSSANSDVTVWIYDITNAVLIQPSNIKLFSNNGSITDKFQASFQTASNSSSYRLIFHVTTTSASAYTLEVDNVSVSPSEYVFGTPVTDWQSYTPTFQGIGTPTNVELRYRRVGDNVEIQGRLTAGTVSAVEARVGLPAGLTSSSTKISTIQHAGGTLAFNTGGSMYLTLIEPSVTYITFGNQTTTTAGLTKVNGTSIGTGTIFSFTAFVPVQGWSSSVQTSDSADTRVVDFVGTVTAQTLTANTTNLALTSVKDSHGVWSTNQFTVPVAGDYVITGTVSTSSTLAFSLEAYIGGSSVCALGANQTTTAARITLAGLLPNLQAGQVITIRANQTVTINAPAVDRVSIFRLSGPSAIAASETVAAKYSGSVNATASTTAPIQWNTKQYDTHNSVTTGASWRFTAPIAGIYRISTVVAASSGAQFTTVYKNGVSSPTRIGEINTTLWMAGVGTLALLAGDYIDVRPNGSVTVQATTDAAISIERIGNYA